VTQLLALYYYYLLPHPPCSSVAGGSCGAEAELAVSTEAGSRQHEHYRIALLPVSLLIEQAGGEGLYFRMESGRARGAG
jgi:hypothetical protein